MSRYIETTYLGLRKPDILDPDRSLGYWGEDYDHTITALDTYFWESLGDITALQIPGVTGIVPAFNYLLLTGHEEARDKAIGDAGHTQFPMLSGRSGGQTLQGGTSAGQNLCLQGNSDSAAIGGIVITTSADAALTVSGGICAKKKLFASGGNIGGAGTNSVCIGEGSPEASGGAKISIGYSARATSTGSGIAIGNSAEGSGSRPVVIGTHASGTGDDLVALGAGTVNSTSHSIRLGTGSEYVVAPGGYHSADDTPGISGTRFFSILRNGVHYFHTVTIKSGLITAWVVV